MLSWRVVTLVSALVPLGSLLPDTTNTEAAQPGRYHGETSTFFPNNFSSPFPTLPTYTPPLSTHMGCYTQSFEHKLTSGIIQR